MTQIWPVFGVAPVPTLLSVICKPEAVVMVFPEVWAVAVWNGASTAADASSNETTATTLAARTIGISSPVELCVATIVCGRVRSYLLLQHGWSAHRKIS